MRHLFKAIPAAFLVLLPCLREEAAEIPGAPLPPPADKQVDFDRDVRPILEQSCLRCHGPEKPRSHFRLDNRASALKGGRVGVDILPGKSGTSPLIRYVAKADDEITMPPPGKGTSLTDAQIGLLRTWIDQGATWGTSNAVAGREGNVELLGGGINLQGNKGKFRELEGTRQGFGGGVKSFSIEEPLSAVERFSAEGHYYTLDDDLQVKLSLTRDDVGFVRGGFEHWRRYTENGGGFDPVVTPPEFMFNSDLFLNEGRAWADFGLTLPNLPVVVLGYEFQYRDGAESTLDWGTVQGKNIYPAMTFINDATHVVKLDTSANWAGWEVENNARLEIHTEKDRDVEPNIFGTGLTPDTITQTRDDYRSIQGMDTFSVEKQLWDWWRVSAGYYYSKLWANDSLDQVTTSAANAPIPGNFWNSPQVKISTDSQIFSVSSLFTPLKYLSFSAASQNEWTHEKGFGEADLNLEVPTTPVSLLINPVSNDSNLDKFKTMEDATVRFTAIPYTVLSADGRLSEEEISEFQEQVGGVPEAFDRQTDAGNRLYDGRGGFNTSPWTWISWNGQVRYVSSDTSYNHVIDSTPLTGYPAFITGRVIQTYDYETKLILRPACWLSTTLSYDIPATDYRTRTDPVAGGISPGGPLTAGYYHARNYGLNVTFTPIRSFYLSAAFTYSISRTTTFNNGDPSIVPYQGHVYTLTSRAGYALCKSVDLSATYSFSEANFGENNAASGVPLGLNYTRHDVTAGITKRFGPRLSAGLHYIFAGYVEPSSGGMNNYNAQGAFATLAYSWR